MNKQLVAIFSTVTFLILGVVNSAVAVSKQTPGKKLVITRASSNAQSSRPGTSNPRSTKKCVPCVTQLAKTDKRRSLGKNAKTIKIPPCHPRNYINPKIAVSYNAAVRDMHRAGIKPEVTSAWRSSENQEQLYRCSMSTRCRRANPGLYRALPAGKSLHEAGFAVDMSGIAAGPRGMKRLTPKGRRIVGIMRKNGFKWRYGLADPAHFEADPRKHGYRTVKHAITQTRTTCELKLAKSTAHMDAARRTRATSAKAPAKARVPTQAHASRTRRQPGKVGT